MSSMVRNLLTSPPLVTGALAALAATSLAALSTPSSAQMGSSDQRGNLVAAQPQFAGAAIQRWEQLQGEGTFDFATYAGFALRHPDFPRMEIIRTKAEDRLNEEAPSQAEVLAFFDTHEPLTNIGRARYALDLAGAQREEALEVAREAWRGGEMSGPAEAYMVGLFGSQFTAEDHAARVDALLWQGDAEAASRNIINLEASQREMALARLSLIRGATPSEAGLTTPADAMNDAGYVYNLANYFLKSGQQGAAISLLKSRPQFRAPAFNPEELVGVMLTSAKAANVSDTVQIARKIDDLFEPGTDISKGSFRLRDRYTDLMWKGGTNALWRLNSGGLAAPLFERYGDAARTPLTKSKGYFWAGRAASRAGMQADATRYFEKAAEYPHYYYGQLALGALGRPMPTFAELPSASMDETARAEFEARPLVKAIRAIAANRVKWQTERRFFQAIGASAKTPQDVAQYSQLAAQTGLPEMAVVLGMEAGANGIKGVERAGFPIVPTPRVNDWTMVHAIARQESAFNPKAVSHAGARGLMQLMPGTAKLVARETEAAYQPRRLTDDPAYNARLGSTYLAWQIRDFDGYLPMAVAAYNAGPHRVKRWIEAHGDPRNGTVDAVDWVERIPFSETRNYVQRVLEALQVYRVRMERDDDLRLARDLGIRSDGLRIVLR